MPAFIVEAGSFMGTEVNETWYDCYLNSVSYPTTMPGLYTASTSIATTEMESTGLMRASGFEAGETTWYRTAKATAGKRKKRLEQKSNRFFLLYFLNASLF